MNTESLTLRDMFKFEKLDVWQKAIDRADLVYSAAIYKAAEEQGRMLRGLRRTLVGN
jgi:hypothetical protein